MARPAADGSGGITYTKHYFAGTQRVSSKIGTPTNLGKFLEEWQQQEQSSPSYPAITTQAQMDKANSGATKVFGLKGFNFTNPPIITGGNTSMVAIPAFTHSTANEGKETDHYFFHPDHLGSSNYITNFVGEVSQHSEYFAFGETFIEEHKNSHNSPYKFNGKELDEESGLYYYGARYYDPRISIWASVDPLVEQTMSAYGYCNLNPVNLIDPTGMSAEGVDPIDPPKPGTGTSTGNMQGTIPKGQEGAGLPDGKDITIPLNEVTVKSAKKVKDYFDAPPSGDYGPSKDWRYSAAICALPAAAALIEASPAIVAGYEGYCSWYAGTALSTSISSVGYLSTFRAGFALNSGRAALFNGLSNATGQVAYNRGFKKFNYLQPLFAATFRNPYVSNFGESYFSLTREQGFEINSPFSQSFISTFGSNYLGGKISAQFNASCGYLPIQNVLDFTTGGAVETFENKIGADMGTIIDQIKK